MTLRATLVWLGLMAAAFARTDAGQRHSQRDVLERVGRYVEGCAAELPRLVVSERAVQTAAPRPQLQGPPATVRGTTAEIGWVPLDDLYVLAVRDVVEVDGRPVPGSRSRLERLLHGPRRGTWAEAVALLTEGARYNLAPGSRNFNLPTVALFFLHPEMQERFSWERRTPREAPVWELEYEEKRRPTVIRTQDGGSAFSRGRVRVDAAAGTVLRTELELEIDRVEYRLVVEFAPVSRLGLTLPATLQERYATPEQVVTGRAGYTNYRRFETRARLVR